MKFIVFRLGGVHMLCIFAGLIWACSNNDSSSDPENEKNESDLEAETSPSITEDEVIRTSEEESFIPHISECGNDRREYGEECDDGNTINGDGCSSVCTQEICGNSIVDEGEECDDGNTINDDGCNNQCMAAECGNGRLEYREDCDMGEKVTTGEVTPIGCEEGQVCGNCQCYEMGDCQNCKEQKCTKVSILKENAEEMNISFSDPDPESIHDHEVIVNYISYCIGTKESTKPLNEKCSNLVSCLEITGCASPTSSIGKEAVENRIFSSCYCGLETDAIHCAMGEGNGRCKAEIEAAVGSIDPSVINEYISTNPVIQHAAPLIRCTEQLCESCLLGTCGNAIHEVMEECDDGNLIDGDGCSAKCESEICGNGRVEPPESCDFGENASEEELALCVDCQWTDTCDTCRKSNCADVLAPCLHGDNLECADAAMCIDTTGCDSETLETCFCGPYTDRESCSIMPNGFCVDSIVALAQTDDFSVIIDMLNSTEDHSISLLKQVTQCDKDRCPMCENSNSGYTLVEQIENSDTDTNMDTDSNTIPDSSTDPDIIDTDILLNEECLDCESTYCAADFVIGESPDVGSEKITTNIQTECDATPHCRALVNCMKQTHCISRDMNGNPWPESHPNRCYCGDSSQLACMTGKANGSCKTEIEAATQTNDPMLVGERIADRIHYPSAGWAFTIGVCYAQSCDICL